MLLEYTSTFVAHFRGFNYFSGVVLVSTRVVDGSDMDKEISSGKLISPEIKVAIVHDWLVTWAGAEKVLAELLSLFPNADLFTLVNFMDDDSASAQLKQHKVTTSFIQRLPAARKHYRHYLPLMPLAVEQFDLSGYQLIISSSHAVAKGVITSPDSLHICYCHSPMRYAWDLQQQYITESGMSGLKEKLTRYLLHRLRQWDTNSSARVDHFIANSEYIARRINKCYRRSAEVIYPPVGRADIQCSEQAVIEKKDFYLAASRLVPYKRIALIVESFAQMPDKTLIVIGDGPERRKIEKQVERLKQQGQNNIKYIGYQDDQSLQRHLAEAKAYVFAAEEDFGILPVEALANGTPVIAFGKGGVAESITEETGVFFNRPDVKSLMAAVNNFEQKNFSSDACLKRAMEFSCKNFNDRLYSFVESKIAQANIPSLSTKASNNGPFRNS